MKRILLAILGCVFTFATKAQTTTDSIGVYAVNNGAVTPIELINYSNTKIAKGFMSAKAKLEFSGKTSPNHFKGAAKFRIFFGQPGPDKVMQLFMFTPNYSIKDFGVGQFEVKKDNRLLTTAKVSAFSGGNTGVKQADNITYNVVEVRPGVYDVTVTGAPGEYCIMHTFRGCAGYNGVFDFTIE